MTPAQRKKEKDENTRKNKEAKASKRAKEELEYQEALLRVTTSRGQNEYDLFAQDLSDASYSS